MFRTLFIILALVLAYLIIRRLWQSEKRKLEHKQQNQTQQTEHMQRCAYCKVYIPDSEAIRFNGKTYCCNKHLELDQRS